MKRHEDTVEQRADELFQEGKERGRRGGGGKLSRSETVTVRLDPKLNYLCELAARAQRRTKSSFIEWAVDHALESVIVPGTSPQQSIADLVTALWDVEEADRLAMLAFTAPFLLTHEEQVLWKLVEGNGLLWRGNYSDVTDEWCWTPIDRHLRWDKLREHYATFKEVAEGQRPRTDLPSWARVRSPASSPPPSPFDDDLDDDVPF
jgi:hypothetical protein